MSTHKVRSFSYQRSIEGNRAAYDWLHQSLNWHQPAGSSSFLQPGGDIKAVIKRQKVGLWKISVGSWEDKFQAILAAPGSTPVAGSAAEQDFRITSPGITYRSIWLEKEGFHPRHLAARVKRDRLQLFDPRSGLWEVSMEDADGWFAEHMTKYYDTLKSAVFRSYVLLPRIIVHWDLATTNQITHYAIAIGEALREGPVFIGKNKQSCIAQEVLRETLTLHTSIEHRHGNSATNAISAIFIQESQPSKLLVDVRDQHRYFPQDCSDPRSTGPRPGIPQRSNGVLAQLLVDAISHWRIPVYAFNPELSSNRNGWSSVDVGSARNAVDKILLQNTSAAQLSNEKKRISNWNMARIFTSLTIGNGNGLTISDSDSLIRNPGLTTASNAPADYLTAHCGVARVFDFSGIDRSNQQIQNIEFVRGL